MLYTTTRNNADTFTAQRVLSSRRAPDGGQFLPFRLPVFSWQELTKMAALPFNARMADILNCLFGAHLGGAELDFHIGRNGIRLHQLGQRLLAAECWHNPQWEFSGVVKELSSLLFAGSEGEPETAGWAETGIRIAVLFALFGDLIADGQASPEKTVDISMVSGTFSAPMAAWYARGMGLPIENIVCCCNENGALWDFICHGQLRTEGIARRTIIPEADILIPEGLEQLICLYGGPAEAERFAQHVREGNTYYVEDGLLSRLRKGIYATVSSEQRIRSTISGSLSAHHYLLAPSAALAYAGLQDYRSRTGISRTALVITDKSPRLDASFIADVLGKQEQALEAYY